MGLVEKVSRAICEAAGDNPEAVGPPPCTCHMARLDHAFPRWYSYRHQAQVVIAVINNDSNNSKD